jgi:hypothetical protein
MFKSQLLHTDKNLFRLFALVYIYIKVIPKLWVFNQLDALFSLFSSIYFFTSTCFKRQSLIIKEGKIVSTHPLV